MEELLFDYGAKPKASFDALFYVAEFGREELDLSGTELAANLSTIFGRPPSLAMIQRTIREVGKLALDVAEAVRRPSEPEAAFMVPLALYREIRPASSSVLKETQRPSL